MGIILAILVFGLIVTIHELGHFLLAKKNGIHVEEFSIGMGPRLFSKVAGDTRYSIKLLPIGGSCMMGEDDVEDMSEGSFNTKPVWARISVIAAGPIFNFILAFIFAVILVAWVGYDKPVIMLDYAEELRRDKGLSVRDAAFQAGERRMRPIFLTSAAASVGVLPMMIENNTLWSPMGAVIFFGTLISMVLIATILPVLYWIVFDKHGKYSLRKKTSCE